MTENPRVRRLLDELYESHSTPEVVCQSCPELLAEVQTRWRAVRRVEAEVDALFPAPTAHGNVAPALLSASTSPPQFPGYRVEGEIGHGGMGVVYRAWDLRLHRRVALKMLLAGAYAQLAERERFLREAKAVAGLQHPNIVQVFEAGDVDGRSFFTMELVEGGSLTQQIRGIPQPVRKAATLVSTLSNAVHAAHEGGIVHRDLKPSNILLASNGTPKVTDFGLARRLEGGGTLTLSGTPIGTPSYMAPEQARGQREAGGRATDVYALGAILYELLTGRPPFRAATAVETLQQVISQEPANPSRLNNQVPRSLDTICLKCLSKEPSRRYGSAAALAEDLQRWLEGRPIHARPTGWAERSWRWARRNPTGATLLGTALALVGLTIGGGMWFAQQRAEAAQRDLILRSEIRTDVAQAKNLRKGFHFREARELLAQARQRLEMAGPGDLRGQVDQALVDLDLVENLDAARLRAATIVDGKFDFLGAEPLYEEAFKKVGMGRPDDDDRATVAARVMGSDVCADIVAALENWATITRYVSRREWLLEVARRADPDPARDSLRQADLWKDGPRITRLVRDVSEDQLSPQLASALGRMILTKGGDAVPLLSAAQARRPQDFWLNFDLGMAMRRAQRWDDALSYYRAAVALRPEVATVQSDLGLVLIKKGRRKEAIRYFREAVRFDPKFALAHSNLGAALHGDGQGDEGMSHLEQAIRLEPKLAVAHYNLGHALLEQGKLDDAMGRLQDAIRLNPNSPDTHYDLGQILIQRKQLDKALDQFQEAVRLDPNWGMAQINLGVALFLKGRPSDAISHYQKAILDPQVSALAHRNLGDLLQGKGQLNDAINHLQEAVRLNPNSAESHYLLGNALQLKGLLIDAIGHYEEAVRLDPKLVHAHFNLAIVLRDKGRLNEAIGHLQEAVKLNPNLVAPRRCLFAFRYDAACSAVRDANGDDNRQPRVGEAERTGLRRRALDWLRANIELTTQLLKSGKEPEWSLSAWQLDPALAGVRDRDALAKLPDAEREQWQRLWADVARQVAADPLQQGRARAARREWTKAADCYARALKRYPTDDGHFWFEYAALLLLSDDRPGYAKACTHLVDRCGKGQEPRPYHAARACTLAPDAIADKTLPGRLAEKEFQGSREFWSLTEQGALMYRAGRFQEAVPLFEQSLRANPKLGAAVLNWLWLALANHRLGKTEEARQWLAKAKSFLDEKDDETLARPVSEVGLDLHNWLEANILRREAEALIEPTVRQSGTEQGKPKSPSK